MKNKALFLDLDWTLIKTKSEATFPQDANDWELIPGIIPAIRPFWAADFLVVIISNQGGIEAGHHTVEEVEAKLESVKAELLPLLMLGNMTIYNDPAQEAARLRSYFCPSFKEHPNRKPNPGMILRAAADLDIDLFSSLFIGDMKSDEEAARNAGIACFSYTKDFIILGSHAFTLLQAFNA